MSTSTILAAVAALLLLVIFGIYNSLVKVRNKVEEAFATMDVYLKKRYDTIPNLVEVVKGYAKHEAETLIKVTQARSNATSRTDQLDQETQISSLLSQIMVTVEKYPELKADSHFLQLQSQLVQLEEDIASARRYYNGSVREFNNKVQTVPTNIIASLFGFKAMPMFEAKSSERNNVIVN